MGIGTAGRDSGCPGIHCHTEPVSREESMAWWEETVGGGNNSYDLSCGFRVYYQSCVN